MARIHIAQHDHDIARLVERWLADAGHEVEVACSADRAYARLSAEGHDLVVLDVDLPGIHLLATAVGELAPAPAVCTLGDPRTTPLRYLPWVPKPFSRLQLRTVVAAALAGIDTGRIRI